MSPSESSPRRARKASGQGRRRAGPESSRAEILQAARELFAARGYEAATIRTIAGRAGVDPALVMHFFDSKDGLFAAVLAGLEEVRPRILAAINDGSADSGRRLVGAYMELWEDPEMGANIRSLVRGAIGSRQATAVVHDFLVGVDATQPIDPGLALAGGQLLGVAIARYVLEAAPLADMPLDELVERIGPSIQRQLDP
jgi:AcrR family transcriptional regulator